MSMSDISDEDLLADSVDGDGGEDSMDEEEAGFEDDDSGFTTIEADKAGKKIYEVDYTVLSIRDIADRQAVQIEELASLLALAPEHAAILLRHYRWNRERLVDRYMEYPEEVARQVGVNTDGSPLVRLCEGIPGFVCDICCDDSPGMASLALSCGHRFCKICYAHYLESKIKDGESSRIQCPASRCKLVVDERSVEILVSFNHFTRYINLLNRAYVDDHEQLRWCPAPNCEYAIECTVRPKAFEYVVPTVVCKCGCRFCFNCGNPDHQPAICFLVKKWLKKCRDDSETANWISVHTKECIECSSTIEKNGGCNHMTCKQCKHEFCWVCMGPWSEHGTSYYQCNRFDEAASKSARDQKSKSRASLERYLHYYNRFENHEQSAKLDRELYLRTERKMAQIQNSSNMSWVEVQFLRNAVQVLCQCRRTLKWTYCFAYYLARDNFTQLFEDNQADLEMAVEALSELCERPIESVNLHTLKQNVLDKTLYVKARREVVLEDTTRGLHEGRWKYTVDV